MNRPILKQFGVAQKFLLVVNVVLILACAISAGGLHLVCTALETTTAAQRFRGGSELRFAQMACYLPKEQGKTEEEIWEFRQGLDAKFVEQSLEVPENGSLYVDAYSSSGKVTVNTDYGTAEVNAFGVGGDFFYFHPLQLRSGSYISERDLMDDLVILDETLAWRLFGGVDLTGMTVYINNEPFLVSGVVAMEDDFATSRAKKQEGALFLSYSALSRLVESVAIDCYEIVLPDPITGYAYGVVEDSFPVEEGDIVENSSRYTLGNLLNVVKSVGERSMQTNGVIYPYWENALRLTEDYAALLLVLTVLFALCPVVSFLVLVIRGIVCGYRSVKRVVPEKIDAAIQRRRELKYEQMIEGE